MQDDAYRTTLGLSRWNSADEKVTVPDSGARQETTLPQSHSQKGRIGTRRGHSSDREQSNDSGSQGAFYFSRCVDVTVHENIAVFPAGQSIPAVEIRFSQPVTVEGNAFENAGETVLNSTPAPAPPAAS